LEEVENFETMDSILGSVMMGTKEWTVTASGLDHSRLGIPIGATAVNSTLGPDNRQS